MKVTQRWSWGKNLIKGTCKECLGVLRCWLVKIKADLLKERVGRGRDVVAVKGTYPFMLLPDCQDSISSWEKSLEYQDLNSLYMFGSNSVMVRLLISFFASIVEELRQADVLGLEYSTSWGGRLATHLSYNFIGVSWRWFAKYDACWSASTVYASTASIRYWELVMENHTRCSLRCVSLCLPSGYGVCCRK